MGRGTRDKGQGKEREGGYLSMHVVVAGRLVGWLTDWLVVLLACWLVARVCNG